MEESIHENETAPDPGNAGAIPLPVSRKKSRVGRLIKEMWPAYLIEILVIILGISITLALEEWRDSGKESRLEEIYLTNLLADVEVDRQSLKTVSAETQKVLDSGKELLVSVRSSTGKALSFGEITTDVRAILSRPKFVSNDVTFSDLKSSGNLHLLKDLRLKNLLFTYYNRVQAIREVQDAEQQATINLSGAYFFKHIPLDDASSYPSGASPGGTGVVDLSGTNLADLSKNIEFRNNVLWRVSIRNELLDLYRRADSLGNPIIQELKMRKIQ
jgi:hypothetical protein